MILFDFGSPRKSVITASGTFLVEKDGYFLRLVYKHSDIALLIMIILAEFTPCLIAVHNGILFQCNGFQYTNQLIQTLLTFLQPVVQCIGRDNHPHVCKLQVQQSESYVFHPKPYRLGLAGTPEVPFCREIFPIWTSTWVLHNAPSDCLASITANFSSISFCSAIKSSRTSRMAFFVNSSS